MAELRAPEQNRLLGQLANMLRTTEGDIAVPEFLPKGLDVMGLVRQLMLPSAETVEKLSYGDPLFRMPTQSNIPITADREYLADIAGMIPFGAPAARPSARAMQDLVRQIQTEPPIGAIRPYNKEEIRRIDEEILSAKAPEGTYFHGTDKAFKDFRRKDRGLAYYFTPDPMQAASYSGMDVGANIRPVKLDIKKTYRGGDVDEIMEVVKKEGDYYPYTVSKMREFLEEQDPKAFHTPSVVKALKKLGYDSFVEYEGGIEQIGVFSAKDVKPSFGAGLLDQPAQSVVEAPKFEMPSFAALRPETEGDIDQIYDFVEQQAKKAGYRVKSGASNISGSRYLTITEDLPDDDIRDIELRISDHGDRHPFSDATEGKISIDPSRGGTDLEAALYELQEKGFNLLR
jgi:hypothetical protein